MCSDRASVTGGARRTLIVSDLHLGSPRRLAVLSRPAARNALLRAVDDCERLILLGDTVELVETGWEQAFRAAEPVLAAIGERLGPDREVVIVPGNHDRRLIGGWLRERIGELTAQTPVPPDASPRLSRLIGALAPARRVRVLPRGPVQRQRLGNPWALPGPACRPDRRLWAPTAAAQHQAVPPGRIAAQL